MAEKSMVRDLTGGNPLKQLLTFALPFVFANLLQQAYNIADMIIVGQFVGSAGLTAASNGGEVATFFLFVSMGFASAGQIIISQHIGAGNKERLSHTIGTLFTFGFLLAAAMTVLSLCICDWALGILNIPAEAQGYAHDYAIVYFCGMIPVFGYNMVSSILRGMGDSKRPFIFIAISATLNVILDLIFVGPMHMSCFGAALATVIAQSASFVVSIIYLYRHRDSFGFDFKLSSFRIYKQELKPLLSMGFPLSVQSVAVSASMLVLNALINGYGVVAAAATAVGNKITMLATIITQAMNTAGNSIVAQSFAAKKMKRVSVTLGCILAVSLAFCLLLGAIVALFPEQIFGLFDRNPDVLALSHPYVIYCIINLIGFATRAASFSLVNGIGFSKFAFVAGLADGLIARIGFSYLFGVVMEMGIEGFWLGGAIAGNVIGVICLFYYLSGKWKNRKLLV